MKTNKYKSEPITLKGENKKAFVKHSKKFWNSVKDIKVDSIDWNEIKKADELAKAEIKEIRANYKALFCNCLGSLTRMTETEFTKNEVRLISEKLKEHNGVATKYTCPECKQEFIGVDAREKGSHE